MTFTTVWWPRRENVKLWLIARRERERNKFRTRNIPPFSINEHFYSTEFVRVRSMQRRKTGSTPPSPQIPKTTQKLNIFFKFRIFRLIKTSIMPTSVYFKMRNNQKNDTIRFLNKIFLLLFWMPNLAFNFKIRDFWMRTPPGWTGQKRCQR